MSFETKICHYDLEMALKKIGFEVQADTDNNDRSLVAWPWDNRQPLDFGERIFAEIIGDEKAILHRIT